MHQRAIAPSTENLLIDALRSIRSMLDCEDPDLDAVVWRIDTTLDPKLVA